MYDSIFVESFLYRWHKQLNLLLWWRHSSPSSSNKFLREAPFIVYVIAKQHYIGLIQLLSCFWTGQKQPSRGVLNKRCSENMQQIYKRTRRVISIKLLCNFIEITLRHGCSPVNLLHIFRTPFRMNTSRRLLPTGVCSFVISSKYSDRFLLMFDSMLSSLKQKIYFPWSVFLNGFIWSSWGGPFSKFWKGSVMEAVSDLVKLKF